MCSIVLKEMEKLVDEGLVRAIGISNFSSKQVQRVLDNCRIKPSIQQVMWAIEYSLVIITKCTNVYMCRYTTEYGYGFTA